MCVDASQSARSFQAQTNTLLPVDVVASAPRPPEVCLSNSGHAKSSAKSDNQTATHCTFGSLACPSPESGRHSTDFSRCMATLAIQCHSHGGDHDEESISTEHRLTTTVLAQRHGCKQARGSSRMPTPRPLRENPNICGNCCMSKHHSRSPLSGENDLSRQCAQTCMVRLKLNILVSIHSFTHSQSLAKAFTLKLF